ncbi:MAG: UDP-N-acetylmuramoyl-L-alanine--D-glutamate ligase [Lachnospiraceae bacterium]|nr:UDP-N-acetylmuramoyl-L-alanine--D-glutamate ligase [Lachnospiraceae bacterium]
MNIADKFNGKKILVWGYGREGKSTVAFLKKNCIPESIDIFEGLPYELDERPYDIVIKSPGIYVEKVNRKFTSQTEIFLEAYREQVIGVTGTKGKSTTSSMLYKVLKDCTDRPVILVGNIGLPCLDYFDEVTGDTIIVYEMSCHQLMHAHISPHIAVFLNFYEEHLDYYKSLRAYFKAKSHIVYYQNRGDFAYVGDNVPELSTKARMSIISPEDVRHADYSLKILGEHNLYNAEFVRRIAEAQFGCDDEAVLKSLSEFEGLPHRLQYVKEKDGVKYYDDSISTIPEAAISAAESIPDAQTFLIGGMDRGVDYRALVNFIYMHREFDFVCMYDSGARIYDELIKHFGGKEKRPPANVYLVKELKEAVEKAKEITKKGRAIVLSPAAASYGHFKNFEERGDVFISLI